MKLPTVSRNHGEITQDENGNYRLTNLSKTNPIIINDKRMESEIVVVLKDGDVFVVGERSFVFQQIAPVRIEMKFDHDTIKEADAILHPIKEAENSFEEHDSFSAKSPVGALKKGMKTPLRAAINARRKSYSDVDASPAPAAPKSKTSTPAAAPADVTEAPASDRRKSCGASLSSSAKKAPEPQEEVTSTQQVARGLPTPVKQAIVARRKSGTAPAAAIEPMEVVAPAPAAPQLLNAEVLAAIAARRKSYSSCKINTPSKQISTSVCEAAQIRLSSFSPAARVALPTPLREALHSRRRKSGVNGDVAAPVEAEANAESKTPVKRSLSPATRVPRSASKVATPAVVAAKSPARSTMKSAAKSAAKSAVKEAAAEVEPVAAPMSPVPAVAPLSPVRSAVKSAAKSAVKSAVKEAAVIVEPVKEPGAYGGKPHLPPPVKGAVKSAVKEGEGGTPSKIPYSVAIISGRKSSALTSVLIGQGPMFDNEIIPEAIIVLDQELKTSQLLFGHKDRVRGTEWSRCGRLLASVGAPPDLSPDLSPTESCAQKAQLMMQGIVDFLSNLSRDSSEELSSTSGYKIGEVIVWDLEYVQPTFRKVIYSGYVEPFIKEGSEVEEQRLMSLCWSPCGSYLACGSTNYIFLLDAATGKIVNTDKMSITADNQSDGPRQIDYPRAMRWGKIVLKDRKDGTEYLAVGSRKKDVMVAESALSIWKLSKDGHSEDGHRKSRLTSEKCTLLGVPLDRVFCLDWSKDAEDELTLVCLSYSYKDRSSASVQQWHRPKGSADEWKVKIDVTIGNAPGLWLAFQDDSASETTLAVSTPEQVFRFVKKGEKI